MTMRRCAQQERFGLDDRNCGHTVAQRDEYKHLPASRPARAEMYGHEPHRTNKARNQPYARTSRSEPRQSGDANDQHSHERLLVRQADTPVCAREWMTRRRTLEGCPLAPVTSSRPTPAVQPHRKRFTATQDERQVKDEENDRGIVQERCVCDRRIELHDCPRPEREQRYNPWKQQPSRQTRAPCDVSAARPANRSAAASKLRASVAGSRAKRAAPAATAAPSARTTKAIAEPTRRDEVCMVAQPY